MPIDDRTPNRSYKLPNAANLLSDDVQRLRDALAAIDADVYARYTKTEVDQLISGLINGAPGALDTLNELAAALGNDANFATTVTTALANRYTKTESDARYVQGVTQTENVFTGNGSQTTFTLTQTPPTRESLIVTVDGVVQPTSEYNLSGSSLVLSEAPANGAKIRVLMLGVAGPVQSSSTLSFAQAGTGATTRTVDSKLKDIVSVKDFGAVGDGIADDTAAVTNAIASQRPLDWGGLSYKITSPISQTVTKPVQWYGGGATITYTGTHTGDAIFLNDTAGVGFVIDNLTIDGSKLCNRILRIENNTSSTTPSTFTANNLSVKRAKRLNTFSGGEAVLIRGAFEYATFNGGIISDCELPAGQGTFGVVGIRGIGVTWYSTTRYVKRLTLNGVRIEKIYSSDPAYTDDQDGVGFFSPNESGSGKLESDFVAMGGCRFINCYGRAIKTQCRNTQVRDCHFQRTEGPTDGNGEINSQEGTCVVNACSFSYRNGKTPGAVVAASTTSNWKTGATIADNEVDLDSSTTLPIFFQSFPSGVIGPWTQMTVSRNRILGTVTQLVDFLCNGEKNFLTVEDNWVEEIGVYSATSTRCLVYTRTSGGSAPYFAHLSLNRNIYAGSNTVQLARDAVTGNSMRAMYSAYGNYGFENGWNASVSGAATTLQSSALPARLTDARNITTSGDQQNYGYFGMQTKPAAAGATVTFNFRASNCSLIILQVSSARTAYALFTADSSITTISSGTGVTMGTTSNPAVANTFNVWRSNTGEISVENTTGTARVVSAWVFAPN